MAEKKIHRRVTEQLTRYVAWEEKAASYLLSQKGEGTSRIPPEALAAARARKEKIYLKWPGLLATWYLNYLTYLDQTTPAERRSLEGLVSKYLLYHQLMEEHGEEKTTPLAEPERIRREALRVMAERHRRGEQRYSDLYNARMLLEDQGEEILYCGPWKGWLIWDGGRWRRDEENRIYQMAVDSIKALYRKALKASTEEETLLLMEHAGRSETARKIEALVRVAAWDKRVRVLPEELDTDLYLFNCANGIVDLTCGRLYPHDRKKRITKISPAPYDPQAPCPRWISFLNQIFQNRKELVGFVQKALGWSLTGDVSSQAMFILYGSGANGKSTFMNTVMKVMGDYGTSTPTETFMQKRSDSANNDIARLKGTRFVSAMEAERGMKLAEAVIKRLTGNDAVSARFLYGEYFEFIPTFKIFMATNHKPKIGGMDNAIWRRIRLIPFEAVFPEGDRDPRLWEKLEKELPGILAWMVEGCLRWHREGLGSPPEVKAATDEYRQEMSAIETFLEEKCTRSDGAMVKASELYEAYKTWCEDNGEHTLSLRGFGGRLGETGMDKVRLTQGVHWLGIELKTR